MAGPAPTLFDTNRFVKRLAGAGFEVPLAVSLASLLRETVAPAVRSISAGALTHADMEREVSRHVLALEKSLGDISVRQTQSLAARKLALDESLAELRALRIRTREALAGMRADRRLELSGERGRQRDEALAMVMRVRELDGAVDAEREAAQAALGKLRHDLLYSLTGFFFTGAAALFGFLRLFSKSP